MDQAEQEFKELLSLGLCSGIYIPLEQLFFMIIDDKDTKLNSNYLSTLISQPHFFGISIYSNQITARNMPMVEHDALISLDMTTDPLYRFSEGLGYKFLSSKTHTTFIEKNDCRYQIWTLSDIPIAAYSALATIRIDFSKEAETYVSTSNIFQLEKIRFALKVHFDNQRFIYRGR